jgi:hypothetical protein
MLDAGPEGYILSTEQITRDTPAEHVLAMVQARDDFLGTSQAPGRSRVEWNGEPQKKER